MRIPARVAARRVLRAFGTAERHAFYACRSFFAKIFSNENILAIGYNDVAKGITSSPQTVFYTCAYGGEERVMRISAVRCARALN